MQDIIRSLIQEITQFEADSQSGLEAFRARFTNKKAVINELFEDFRNVPKEDKREVGQMLNELKTLAFEKLATLQELIESKKVTYTLPHDLSLPGDAFVQGARHPLATVMNRIIHIFEQIGFEVASGPEIEDDWHNFSALNFQDNHPARDMQDTFFVSVNPDFLLRTHTSSVQIRVMEKQKPPIRILAPGRVYRNEAVSARSHCFFHQVEGLYIDKDVSFADMQQTLLYFAKAMFGEDVKIRLRPSYFPFTEISAEMDVSCQICKGDGCNVCKYTGWLEIMGCGMVDPNVLENCGIDSSVYSGYAFGMGIDRLAMMTYKVPDLRMFSQNDIRFLKQFEKMEL
ncbi:MAG: phenylalanine--tRNA ligase subunit alpha [Bacteroidia bacterium]|nr:phenylalanine--tRNA ligase subunit alpha [Bacteroidia bacterium]